MSRTPWEDIVQAARELDRSFARGDTADSALAGGLARAVLEFQQRLTAMRQAPFKPPASVRPVEQAPIAAAEAESNAA